MTLFEWSFPVMVLVGTLIATAHHCDWIQPTKAKVKEFFRDHEGS